MGRGPRTVEVNPRGGSRGSEHDVPLADGGAAPWGSTPAAAGTQTVYLYLYPHKRIINPHLPPAFSSGRPGRDAHYFLPSCSPAPQPPTRRAASVGLLRASQLRASAKMDLDSKGVDPAGRCRCWRWRSRSTTPYSRGDYRHECDTSVTATTRCAAGARAVTLGEAMGLVVDWPRRRMGQQIRASKRGWETVGARAVAPWGLARWGRT